MTQQIVTNAPAHLRPLLKRLYVETAIDGETVGLLITQHLADPQRGEWYAGWGSGDIGPFATAEDALVAGVHWLYRLYREAGCQ